jgi:hypothetical protein
MNEHEHEHEARESALLERGETALSDDHLYFAFGDIQDVYVARALTGAGAFVFALVKIDPLTDDDDALNARQPSFKVAADGWFHAVGLDGELLESRFSVKALQPFGERQLAWYTQLRDNSAGAESGIF